ncbi:hypothetical protein BC833DRAFT_393370 [Globomyces pollinis-pini]|nr:hypothetical protein BC833DRAFT_393370 [Globomyces pollinis-pini]
MAGLNDQLIEAHGLLGNFLQNYLKQIGGPSTTVATARIVRLPLEHLNELANDLTDEADRRTNSLNGFLPTRSDLLPKRNEVRQRLATLPENRFNDLCAQVYFEIEKRIPVPKVCVGLVRILYCWER